MINNLLLRLAGFTYQRALMFGLIAGAFYYFSAYDDGAKLDQQIIQAEGRLKEEEKKVADSELALKEAEKIKNSIKILQEQFKGAAEQLPTEIVMADVLKSLDTLARSSGVSIKDKEPRTQFKDDFLEIFPLRIRAQGTYSEITMFIYYIASMQRITRVRNFTISQITGANRKPILVFEGEVASYRFIPEAVVTEVPK